MEKWGLHLFQKGFEFFDVNLLDNQMGDHNAADQFLW